ncbi:NAD(P)H-dependent oxidoreductase [Pseudomonas sp. Q11]|nr:NAD(P)H-dependent oxidoreductase [Pseudomonas sp. Q11]MCQ6257757.1 NAD(P)H-dependent oxidoreductase [Pseudomonas sp. Q11]
MNILHIDCSSPPESHSRQLSAAIVKKLLEVTRGARIGRRDFASAPLPHASPEYATALSSPATLAARPTRLSGVCDPARPWRQPDLVGFCGISRATFV